MQKCNHKACNKSFSLTELTPAEIDQVIACLVERKIIKRVVQPDGTVQYIAGGK